MGFKWRLFARPAENRRFAVKRHASIKNMLSCRLMISAKPRCRPAHPALSKISFKRRKFYHTKGREALSRRPQLRGRANFFCFRSAQGESESKKNLLVAAQKGAAWCRRSRCRAVPVPALQRGPVGQSQQPEQRTTEVVKRRPQKKQATKRKIGGKEKKMQITDYLNRFDTYLQASGFAINTRQNYARTMRKFCHYLEYSNSPLEVSEIRKDHLIEFLANCQENGEKNNTVALRALTLMKFFRWLKESREITTDPSERIPIPKETQRVPRYISPQQIAFLLSQPDIKTVWGLRDRALMQLIYSAGLRISEALDLRIQDLNFEEGLLYIRNGKGGKSRTVPLGANASHWLQRYLAEARKKLLRCSCNELVFVSRSGERISRQRAAKAVAEYVQGANLPRWITPHSLRHACASHMLHGGADLIYIQELLGHERIESTQIYTLVRSTDLKSVHAVCHPDA